jgi:hypothetical protein
MPVVIASNQSNQDITPNFLRVSGVGAITVPVFSFSISNVGPINGVFLGETIKPNEFFDYDAGTFNRYAANTITYDATGTEFIILYNSL